MTAELRDRIDELEETIRQLRDELVPQELWLWFPREWKLTPTESKVLAFVMARSPEMARRESLLTNCFSNGSSDDPPDIKIVDVVICKLRQKMAPLAIDIQTVRGNGYEISKRDADILRLICDAEKRGDRVDDFVRIARVRDLEAELGGCYLDCSGAVTSPEQLELVITELRCAAERAWPEAMRRQRERRVA